MDYDKVISCVEQLMNNKLDALKSDFGIIIDMLKTSAPKGNEESSIKSEEIPAAGEPISSPDDIEFPFFEGTQKNVIIQNNAEIEAPDILETKKADQTDKTPAKTPIEFAKVNPIFNLKDYVGEVVIIFSSTKPTMGFMEFVMTYEFSKVLNQFKFYSLNVLKQLYAAYTGNHDMDETDVTDILDKQAYYTGVTAFKYDNRILALSLRGIEILQHNVVEYSSEDAKEPEIIPAPETSSSTPEQVEENSAPKEDIPKDYDVSKLRKNSISTYLLYEIDTDKIIKEDMAFADVAAAYNQKYDRNIVTRSIRNTLASNGISPLKIFGKKKSRIKGQDLAYLIQLLRDNYGVVKDKEAEAKNTLVTFTQNDTAKMTYAIGDIFKQKLA